MSFLHVHIHDKVAWITLSRPEKLNALNGELMKELDRTFVHLESNEKVQVVVVTGAGDKAFAAGADIAEMQNLDPLASQSHAKAGQAIFNRIEAFPKPVIAAVNGWALGGGLELALACHMRVASEEAKFGFPEVNLGILPGYGGTQRLTHLVGKSLALDMLLTGEPISAEEALAVGLVSRVFTAADLASATEKLARTILGKAPMALRAVLAAVLHGEGASQAMAQQFEAALFGLMTSTQDMQEGIQAFLEKRTPKFKGR